MVDALEDIDNSTRGELKDIVNSTLGELNETRQERNQDSVDSFENNRQREGGEFELGMEFIVPK